MTASRKLFEALAGASLPGWEDFEAKIATARLVAGASVFRTGDPVSHLFVVSTGLVKLTYLREDGSEWIKSFHAEGAFFSSISALAGAKSAGFSATALESCVVEKLPYRELERRAEGDLSWSRAFRAALVLFAVRKEEREREFLTLNAEQRYRSFATREPALMRRVTQKDLAAYLGVTPVGLNRIAKRVAAGIGRTPLPARPSALPK
jgi:CRP-like cAMP-binding protein